MCSKLPVTVPIVCMHMMIGANFRVLVLPLPLLLDFLTLGESRHLVQGAGKELNWDKQGKKAAWVSAIVAASCAIVLIPVVFWLKKRLAAKLAKT